MSKVLIVEDDARQRDSVKVFLQEKNFVVETAADGESGIKIAREWIPDVIVLDLMLPFVDGYSACRILSKSEQLQNTSILVTSARSDEMDKIVALESGADDYMVKPVSLEELLARIKTLNRRKDSRKPEAREIRIGDMYIDFAGRKAFLHETEVVLSSMQFAVLGMLMKHAGTVLSRDLLLNHIWGRDYIGDPRTVDVHIRWIREKIEDNPSQPEKIISVRGVGYRYNNV